MQPIFVFGTARVQKAITKSGQGVAQKLDMRTERNPRVASRRVASRRPKPERKKENVEKELNEQSVNQSHNKYSGGQAVYKQGYATKKNRREVQQSGTITS